MIFQTKTYNINLKSFWVFGSYDFRIKYELHQAKRGLLVILEMFMRNISAFDSYKSIYWFCANTFENKCYSIFQKRLSRMLDFFNCDVIYYVIYVICSHYVGKAISPLFAWPSSIIKNLKRFERLELQIQNNKFILFHVFGFREIYIFRLLT